MMHLVSLKQLQLGQTYNMKKINEKLSEIFDVEPIKVETPKQEVVPIDNTNAALS